MNRHDTQPGHGDERLPDPGDLAGKIEQHIARRAGGQVHGLRVVFSGGRIVLQGHCRTYHAKQVVQEAAFDLVEGLPQIINQIVVGQSLDS